MKFTEKTRNLVVARAGGNCELCGAAVNNPNLHHRKPRGMGGTKNPESRSPANALFLHFTCHEWVERNRTESYELGYLVRQAENSNAKPVLGPDGWFLLNDDGTKAMVEGAWDFEGKQIPRPSVPSD